MMLYRTTFSVHFPLKFFFQSLFDTNFYLLNNHPGIEALASFEQE